MTTENDKADPNYRVKGLTQQVAYLQGLLHNKKQESTNLHNEVSRWRAIAEENNKSWHRAHDALNLLRQDAQAVLDEHGAAPLYRELERARAEVTALNRVKDRRRALTREAVERLALARQEARDAHKAIQQLLDKVTNLEAQLEGIAEQAQDVIDKRDEKLGRFKRWCESWVKGQFGAMEILAAITGELNGNFTLEPDALERRRALAQIETLALMNDSATSLGEIVELLGNEGIALTETPVEMVKEYIALMKEGRSA